MNYFHKGCRRTDHAATVTLCYAPSNLCQWLWQSRNIYHYISPNQWIGCLSKICQHLSRPQGSFLVSCGVHGTSAYMDNKSALTKMMSTRPSLVRKRTRMCTVAKENNPGAAEQQEKMSMCPFRKSYDLVISVIEPTLPLVLIFASIVWPH